MGYYTIVSGKIRFEPPLRWTDFKDSAFYVERSGRGDLNVRFHVEEDVIDTPDGELTRRTAVALVAATNEGYKAYNLLGHVQQAIDLLGERTFTGYLECDGEGQDDLWRIVVRDGTAWKIEPTVVWPDDAEGGASDGR